MHGLSGTRVYSSWRNAKKRCYNTKCKEYPLYGGRGIIMCERWKHSFQNFLADMGVPGPGETLDRINSDGIYELSNCRWSTRKAQSNNRRDNTRLSWGGETLTVSEWADRLNVEYGVFHHRLGLYGIVAAFDYFVEGRPWPAQGNKHVEITFTRDMGAGLERHATLAALVRQWNDAARKRDAA